MPSRTVVILGGGVGGMIAANQCAGVYAGSSRSAREQCGPAFAPSFWWLMT
jgi:ribose 5-phosphate isomerase RpiB